MTGNRLCGIVGVGRSSGKKCATGEVALRFQILKPGPVLSVFLLLVHPDAVPPAFCLYACNHVPRHDDKRLSL